MEMHISLPFQVWGVVCDNASNNAAMMKELETYHLKRLKGPASRVSCVLHVLNLTAQVRFILFISVVVKVLCIFPVVGSSFAFPYEAPAAGGT